ncbi:cytochrome c-type biogenesis protein CcmH [Marinibaculum pumilum]|uniref:Cytochrome c-type biogenesis protein n=1 Tax=Marinibaculum pumilum TaxID=1766165 RepID=A0ABV7KXK5_9PROT
MAPLHRFLAAVAILLAACLSALPAAAIGVDRPLDDPVAERRAQDIAETLRCLVCQNQTIAESDADLARDLRGIIREQVAEGRSDDQIRGFLVDRYGQWVLMRPPFNWRNAVLWIAPALILLAGIVLVLRRRRRMAQPGDTGRPLSAAEEARLAALLDRDET